jgi:TP901 family phage tail tape measure protein
MANRFSIETVFKAVDRVTAPVKRMQNRVGKMSRSMERNFHRLNRSVDAWGRKAKSAAVGIAASMAIASVAIAGTINTGADFGRAIGSAAAKFPEQIQRGTKEFRALEQAARDVGRTTEYTSVQAAQGLNFLAKAGFDYKFSVASLKDIVDFATASEIEFAEAADIASDALGAFGLDSLDTEKKMTGLRRVMDVMAKTANSTNVSVQELFESVKMGAPLADTAGSSIETFSAIMGYLAGNGIKATVAGTASKNITLALAGIGHNAEKVFNRLGIRLADSTGNMRDQLDVLDDLRNALSGFGQKKQLALIEAIFGKIPIASAAKLMKDTTGRVRELRKEFEGATGYNKKAAAFIRDDVRGSLDSLKSAIEGVAISIFSMNEGPLKDAIDKATDWVRANEKVIATNIGGFFVQILSNFD